MLQLRLELLLALAGEGHDVQAVDLVELVLLRLEVVEGVVRDRRLEQGEQPGLGVG